MLMGLGGKLCEATCCRTTVEGVEPRQKGVCFVQAYSRIAPSQHTAVELGVMYTGSMKYSSLL